MLVIKNKLIPFGEYDCINLFGVVFIKVDMTERAENHERIHTIQQLECFGVGFLVMLALRLMFGWSDWWLLLSIPSFYYWYVVEYIVKRFRFNRQVDAYAHIAMECEAHEHDDNLEYLYERKAFAWIKYL